jgi:hypothetical protein
MTMTMLTKTWWISSGAWSGKHWYGPNQVEDRSGANVRACYRYLRSCPYQSTEDLERLQYEEHVAVAEALMTRDDDSPTRS